MAVLARLDRRPDAPDHAILGDTRAILYGIPGTINTYEVIAIDGSGNRSAPGTLVLDPRF